ncbi:MAG: hypothetical protein GX625_11070, partial [Clostridiaceae bacterium]|nr:hypothetical protein [Clostridiaceae bacterium]
AQVNNHVNLSLYYCSRFYCIPVPVFTALQFPFSLHFCFPITQTDMKIFLHSCGSVKQFIPDLIEVGIDILNPVQTNSRDMDPESLKKEFGRDIIFWGGGVDTASVINHGTPEEVRRDVLRRCEIFSKDGGFVFAPIHNILSEVSPENIVAVYNAVREFNGNYS